MKEVDFEADDFADILSKDSRYDARAYALLTEVFHNLSEHSSDHGHVTGAQIVDEFKEYALDQYGPMTYTVLTEWGLNCTEDIGVMMFNLVDAERLSKDESDSPDAFIAVYDFKEAFLYPYQA